MTVKATICSSKINDISLKSLEDYLKVPLKRGKTYILCAQTNRFIPWAVRKLCCHKANFCACLEVFPWASELALRNSYDGHYIHHNTPETRNDPLIYQKGGSEKPFRDKHGTATGLCKGCQQIKEWAPLSHKPTQNAYTGSHAGKCTY